MSGVFGRLPAAVFMIVAMLAGASVMRALGVTSGDIALWLRGDVAWLVGLAITLLPLLSAIAGLVALVEWSINRRDRAIEAAIAAVGIASFDMVWQFTPFGAWALAHISGTA